MKIVEKRREYTINDIPYGNIFKFRNGFYMKIISDNGDFNVIDIYTTKQMSLNPDIIVEVIEGAFVEGYVEDDKNGLPFCTEE